MKTRTPQRLRSAALVVLAGLPTRGVAGEATPTPPEHSTDPSPLCAAGGEASIHLERSEVRLSAYDSGRGLAALVVARDLPPTAQRPAHMTLTNEGPLLVPMSAAAFHEAIEAQDTLSLDVSLTVRSGLAAPPEGCAAGPWRVRAVEARLTSDALPIASGAVGPHAVVPRPTGVVAGRVSREGRSAPPTRAEDDALSTAMAVRADACLDRLLSRLPDIRGALVVELEVTQLGERRPASVVVDGVQIPPLTRCIEAEAQTADAPWQTVRAGERAYVPLYFSYGLTSAGPGAAPVSSAGAAASFDEPPESVEFVAGADAGVGAALLDAGAGVATGMSPP